MTNFSTKPTRPYRNFPISARKPLATITVWLALLWVGCWPTPAAYLPQSNARTVTAHPQVEATDKDPKALLAAARTLSVHSTTGFAKRKTIEDRLLKRKDFQQSGLTITKDSTLADLWLEVDHSHLTTRFPFTVTDRRTRIIVASGNVSSIFGTVAGKIADSFMKQLKAARPVSDAKTKK